MPKNQLSKEPRKKVSEGGEQRLVKTRGELTERCGEKKWPKELIFGAVTEDNRHGGMSIRAWASEG